MLVDIVIICQYLFHLFWFKVVAYSGCFWNAALGNFSLYIVHSIPESQLSLISTVLLDFRRYFALQKSCKGTSTLCAALVPLW
jgi:hypothetical protein